MLVTSLLLSSMGASISIAVDGVIEINQIRALAGGITPADTPGFPITISQTGSYRLTGSLSNDAGPAANIIEVTADVVTIDFNGFAIFGGQVCSETAVTPNVVTCTDGGFGTKGITGTASSIIRIENGRILGMNDLAVDFPTASSVSLENMLIAASGEGNGCIHLGTDSRVVSTTIGLCDGNAITIGNDCVIESTRTQASGANGIDAGSRCSIQDAFVRANGGTGIDCDDACLLVDNFVADNSTGIITAGATILTRNLLSANQTAGSLGPASNATQNVVSGNTTTGLTLGTGSGYGHNTFDNNAGTNVTGGLSRGDNVCGGSSC